MAVTGVLQRNAAAYQPYRQSKTAGEGTPSGFEEAYLAESALVQTGTAANQDSGVTVDDINLHLSNMVCYRAIELRSDSDILGFGAMDDGMQFIAKYADDSTGENPIVQVQMTDKEGKIKTVRVKVNEVDVTNATQLEMFAYLTNMEAQKTPEHTNVMESYNELIARAQNSANGDLTSKNMQDFTSWRQNWRSLKAASSEEYSMSAEEKIRQAREAASDGVPYSYLAKDGIIDYNGVIFVCDTKNKSLCLGDTSNPKNCITIGLSGGGSLVVNRDNLGDLAKAIGMFSPEDVNLILRAIAEDAKIQQMKQQIDDETSGLDIAENTGEQETDEESSEVSLAQTLVGEKRTEENDKK
ncbi:MAG: hypothetical protein NC321_12860 [Clostridium sp.]|nr:hypothetical protein [Clostridium sp.]